MSHRKILNSLALLHEVLMYDLQNNVPWKYFLFEYKPDKWRRRRLSWILCIPRLRSVQYLLPAWVQSQISSLLVNQSRTIIYLLFYLSLKPPIVCPLFSPSALWPMSRIMFGAFSVSALSSFVLFPINILWTKVFLALKLRKNYVWCFLLGCVSANLCRQRLDHDCLMNSTI